MGGEHSNKIWGCSEKKNPEKVDGDKQTAIEPIELLEGISNDQAWSAAKATAGLSVKKL